MLRAHALCVGMLHAEGMHSFLETETRNQTAERVVHLGFGGWRITDQ